MAFFEWKDEYRVGIEDIDYQHERLVDMVNRLHDNMSIQGMRLFVEVFLDRLVDYTDYHFKVEEKFMRDADYGGYDAHKGVHDKLRGQVLDFKERFMRSEAEVNEQLMDFLRDWLVNHICGTDRETGTYLKQKGVGVEEGLTIRL